MQRIYHTKEFRNTSMYKFFHSLNDFNDLNSAVSCSKKDLKVLFTNDDVFE